MKKTVDVIIPAYNAECFIEATIQSVLSQTFLPRKIIIVADGPSDNTVAIVRGIENDLIELIALPENRGVSHARNTGIRASRADYIAFLDADDLWHPQKLEAQLQQLGKNPKAGVCYSLATFIDEASQETGKEIYSPPWPRGKVFEDILFYERCISGSASSVIVAREALWQTSFFDEALQFAEDLDLWARLALVTEFDYVEEFHVKLRVHSLSATRQPVFTRQKEIILQHFCYLNKFADQYSFPSVAIAYCQKHIAEIFSSYPCEIIHLPSFHRSLKERAPHLMRQMRPQKFFIFSYYILVKAIRIKIKFTARVKLFLTEGTIFFAKSKKYCSNKALGSGTA